MKIALDLSLLFHDSHSGVHRVALETTQALLALVSSRINLVLTGLIPREKQTAQLFNDQILQSEHIEARYRYLPQRLIAYGRLMPSLHTLTTDCDIYHNFDGPLLTKKTVHTALLCDLTPIDHPEWHNKANIQAFKRRLKDVVTSNRQFVISEATRRSITEKFPQLADTIQVLTMGTNHVVVDKGKSPLRKYGIEKPYFLGVGNFEPRKNWERVIRAFTQLDNNIQAKYDLVLVGATQWNTNFQINYPQVKYLKGIQDRDLYSLYSQAEALVYPSLYEGYGLPAAEAMRCGTIVVTTNKGGLAEVGGNLPIRVEPLHVFEISQALMTIITMTPTERSKRGSASIAWAEKLNWTITAQQMVRVWESLITSRIQQ